MPWEERRDVVHGGVVYHNQETGVTTRVCPEGSAKSLPRPRGSAEQVKANKAEKTNQCPDTGI